MTHDNIKSEKKQGIPHSLKDTFLEKPQGGIFVSFNYKFIYSIYSIDSFWE